MHQQRRIYCDVFPRFHRPRYWLPNIDSTLSFSKVQKNLRSTKYFALEIQNYFFTIHVTLDLAKCQCIYVVQVQKCPWSLFTQAHIDYFFFSIKLCSMVLRKKPNAIYKISIQQCHKTNKTQQTNSSDSNSYRLWPFLGL